MSKLKFKVIIVFVLKLILFSNEEDDLFGSKVVEEKLKVEEKKEVVVEIFKLWKLVGGVFVFGGVDLFVGKKLLFFENKEEVVKEELKIKEGEFYGECLLCF